MQNFTNFDPATLEDTAKVYSLLKEVIEEEGLSAISVECFSMVMRDKFTACLPLAVLNSKNVVATCEGAICSMLGKMLIRAITNEIPWQANIAENKRRHHSLCTLHGSPECVTKFRDHNSFRNQCRNGDKRNI